MAASVSIGAAGVAGRRDGSGGRMREWRRPGGLGLGFPEGKAGEREGEAGRQGSYPPAAKGGPVTSRAAWPRRHGRGSESPVATGKKMPR